MPLEISGKETWFQSPIRDDEQPRFSGKSPARVKQRAKKTRKRKRSPSPHSDKSSDEVNESSSSSGSSSSEEESQHDDSDEEQEKPAKIPRFRATSSEKKHKWKLPRDMARYVNKHLNKYIPEKDLKDSIMDQNPVPSNVRQFR